MEKGNSSDTVHIERLMKGYHTRYVNKFENLGEIGKLIKKYNLKLKSKKKLKNLNSLIFVK